MNGVATDPKAPVQWTKEYSNTHEKDYWFNCQTGLTQWNDPLLESPPLLSDSPLPPSGSSSPSGSPLLPSGSQSPCSLLSRAGSPPPPLQTPGITFSTETEMEAAIRDFASQEGFVHKRSASTFYNEKEHTEKV